MAQHDYDIANDTGANVRADINSALDAIQSMNSGASAPSSAVTGQLYYDTSDERVYQYDGTTWNTIWFHDASANEVSFFGNLRDANGVIVFNTSTAASAVNNLAVANAATGSSPTLSAEGDDTDIDIILSPKGDGVVDVGGNGTLAKVVSYVPTQDGIYMVAATTSYSGAATNIGTHGFQHHYKIDGSGESRITVDGSISSASTELWSLNQNGEMDLYEGTFTSHQVGSVGNPSLGVGATNTGLYSTGTALRVALAGTNTVSFGTASVFPGADNTYSMGGSTFVRWSVVYAATGSIQTSDATMKTDIQDLSKAELKAARSIAGSVKRYKWKDAIEAKGKDARYHFGVIAQEVEKIMQNEGLDPFKYGMICVDRDEDGNERHGVRYEELHSFMMSVMFEGMEEVTKDVSQLNKKEAS